ncbi:hypothetical protein Msil_2484 [Methylocella silvestris BL2]|uniref:Polysaccharide biosynthesis protein n=1 Tax=Methylocella silvestris (strain DSM 15510 / CIP 108128 / LMG 27833 / NCIMB 13906 / BL2) TaxID=395965 RepID=B8EM23_METSB|nr:hypothetical protein [Methylocella silvestris]ACK51412.1 hypothetical protein Msil_2484 [Methylocella silvestris BL2]
MTRTFLMIRSVAFAFVTKLSGGATVFVALPVISHGVSSADYATFLTTMNVTAVVGLIFLPYAILYIRELAHAFATEDRGRIRAAIRDTFGSHVFLLFVVCCVLALASIIANMKISLSTAMIVGIILNLVQVAASWGQLYRIAERTDHVTSIIQTATNVLMVICLLALSYTNRLSALTVCVAYFGIPAAAEIVIFAQLLVTRKLRIAIDGSAVAAFKARMPESIPLYLSPVADYVKVYASAMLVLIATTSYDYIVFSTSILLMARLVNPVTLVTRPMMPAFIDALLRDDRRWLDGLRKALFGSALVGAAIAAVLPFCINKEILTFAFPKEVRDVSFHFIVFCSYFAFSYALVALLAPLYIGARRAPFYGIANLGFTLAGAASGTLLSMKFGAAGMMGALAIATTVCGFFLLISMNWAKDGHVVPPPKSHPV